VKHFAKRENVLDFDLPEHVDLLLLANPTDRRHVTHSLFCSHLASVGEGRLAHPVREPLAESLQLKGMSHPDTDTMIQRRRVADAGH